MRPFWVHQLAEYLIGAALVAQGMQDPDPLIPVLAGGLVVVNAAVCRGPLGAFKTIGRATHRWLDLAVMVLLVVGAVQPFVPVASTGRVLLLVMLLPLGFLWFYTDWAERPQRSQRRRDAAGATGEHAGRTAGRMAGAAYSAARATVRKQRRT